MRKRLEFELDERIDAALVTAHAGAPLVAELYRACGAAEAVDRLSAKERRRGLSAAETVESLLALWAVGGERCEDLERLREDEALAELLGHALPAPQTARDFLEGFHEEGLPLLQSGERARVPAESERLRGLAEAALAPVRWLQARAPERIATLDVDATILESSKRAAEKTYDGRRGYQPVFALWAERDQIVADEFRDGNVPAAGGNRRVIERALAALPEGVEEVRLRADSALYEHAVLRLLEERGVGYAVSADMGAALKREIEGLPAEAWRLDREEADAIRQWAEVVYVPEEDRANPAPPRRYLAIRILKKQGALFADGSDRRCFCVVTNREGDGGELLRWHRGKAGTIERAHDVLTNELAAEALPSQKFGANAAWVRLNILLYNVLAALRRAALPGEFRAARPKRLRFALLNTVGKVVRHARETLLRLASAPARALYDAARTLIRLPHPPLAGV